MNKISKTSSYGYIPQDCLKALDDRFRKGLEHYKDQAWNSTSDNWDKLDDETWIFDRARHAYTHISHFLMFLENPDVFIGDDDGAAIMWFGCLAHEVWMRRKRQEEEKKGK